MRSIVKLGFAALLIAVSFAVSPVFSQVPPGPADKKAPVQTRQMEPGAATPGAWRARQLLGQTLTTGLNQSVGTIDDIVIDGDGKVAAILVGVGGFLGMGERLIPIALRHLVITPREGGQISVETSLTREAINQAATLDPLDSPLAEDERLP